MKRKAPEVAVKRFRVETRDLITVKADDPGWAGEWKQPAVWEKAQGAIVRVQPPADATDEQITSCVCWLEECGVSIVRVDSRAQAALAPIAATAHMDKRAVVMGKAKASKRKELVPYLDEELTKAGV